VTNYSSGRRLIRAGAIFLAAASSGSLAAALHAETAPAATSAASADAPAAGEIVVTAQKREERLQKVPISVSVIGGKALDERPTGGALEALSEVPGISQAPTSIGNAQSIAIRGVSPGSPFLDGSPTVGYYIDSIPFSLVKSATVPNANAYDMARVEVLRGPQGTLYGASSLNGVVRLLTNDADPTHFEGKARAGLSTTAHGGIGYRGDAAVNVPIIEDKVAIRLVGGYERLGGWIDQPVLHKTNSNWTNSKNLRAKVDIRPTENLKIDLTAWISREKDGGLPYADDGKNQSTPLPLPQSIDYSAYNAKITYDLPSMSISSATSYLDLKRTSYADYSFVTPTSQLFSILPAKVFSEEVLLNSNGNGPWRWSAGAFYRKAHDDLYQTLPPVLAGPIYWRDSSQSYAVFGQLTRSFADDRFELTAGLRYFHDKVGIEELDTPGGYLPLIKHVEKFHAVTPRVVATWLPSPRLTVYASYSQGFRSGFNQSPLALIASPSLPAVQADKLNNYEVGAKGSLFDGFVTYDASVYYIKWTGVQQSGQIVYNGVVIGASINGSSASGVGTDLSVTLHPATGLQIGAGFSYNGLKQDEDVKTPTGLVFYYKGDRLAYSAGYTANAFLKYAFAVGEKLDAHLDISANFRSAQNLNYLGTPTPSNPLPPPTPFTSDRPLFVNANFDIANHHGQTVSLYVQNLTGWNGVIVPAPLLNTLFRTRPRTIGIQFETKF
jgi:iron complex outermembrane receptor protein